MEEIKVKCKKCGKEWDAEKLVLDPVYKMMVCPQCVQERIQPSKKPKEIKPSKREEKPPGWDKEDELLEKIKESKTEDKDPKQKIEYEKIDENNLRIQCPKCSFKFKYDLQKNVPKSCPYCDLRIKVK